MKQKRYTNGFTIAEVITIVAVIAILTALAILGFGSWRTSVAKAEVKSDIANLQSSMEDVRNRTDDYPVFSVGTKFTSSGAAKDVFIQSEHVEITYAAGDPTYYCINFQSLAVESVSMYLDTTDGNATAKTGTC